jgi:SAM-dependent methyltransferase
MPGPLPTLDCPCEGAHLALAFSYDAPPEGETRFDFGPHYARSYQECRICGHWFAHHDLDLSTLYSGEYMDAKYGERLRATYDRIMALPPGNSDNVARVARIQAFGKRHLNVGSRQPRLLDIGSGLAVFPARMREAGWDCTAVDPDAAAVEHAQSVAKVKAIKGDFRFLDTSALGLFDLITFNKVLEHIEAPSALLPTAARLLEPHGILYVEVPDVAAAAEGPGREEFFVEHHHVFSPASLVLLIERIGLFSVIEVQRFREASGKFTLCAFARLGGRAFHRR